MDESWKSYVRAVSHYNTDEWRMVMVAKMTGDHEYVDKANAARWKRCLEIGITAEDLAAIGIEPPEGLDNDQ